MGKREVQADKVLAHMRTVGGITQIDALNEYGIMRLASRISDLKKQGHAISKQMVSVLCKDGSTSTVARYFLAEGE